MFQLIVIAFVMGLAGSFHCVGMCGPLALALPLAKGRVQKFWGALLYNLGRIITYSCWGLLFGSIGQTVAFFGFQQYLSITIGAIILIVLITPKTIAVFPGKAAAISKALAKLRNRIAKLFSKKSLSSLFVIGLLNGLLPCGLVYMAAAASLAAGSIPNSVVFMAAFGFGTFPLMMSISFFGSYLGITARKKIRSAYPYMMGLMACLLIIRGMGLGIPYVSPELSANKKTIHNCCMKH
jgi:hypothetical protein